MLHCLGEAQNFPQYAMLRLYANESHIELLSLSQDWKRIAQCFFRDERYQENGHESSNGSDASHIESTLAALADECRQIPEFERWLQQPASFQRSVAELSVQLQHRASKNWLILISRDFEALVLIESLRMTLDSQNSRSLHPHIIATIFLEAPDLGHPPLSKSPLAHSNPYEKLWSGDLLSRWLARSVWKFQRQRWSFRRIGISKGSERDLSNIYNGFDPNSWRDAFTTRWASFTYVSCALGEVSGCLLWTIWLSMQGHQKLHRALKPANAPCDLIICSGCTFCRSPLIYLERLLKTRSPERGLLLLRVLRWVAYSLRPLEVQELLVAISTNIELHTAVANAETIKTELLIGNQEDLLAFCGGMLGLSDRGTICFLHESVRNFVQSPAMRAFDTWEDSQVHEMMAGVCLRHVVCLDDTAVIRPWMQAEKELRDRQKRCHFRDYSTLHWHQHFRLAESTSMYLPSLLYRMLQSAFQKLDSESGIAEGIIAVERWIDQGLQFCCRHDFLVVGKMFLEMGAKTRYPGWSILHIAAASGATNLVKYLLSSQHSSDHHEGLLAAYQVREALSPIALAAFHGRASTVEPLLLAKTSTTHYSKSDWASAYVIALEYGHTAVVRTFLKCGRYPRNSQEDDDRAMRLARELGHHGIVEVISNHSILSISNSFAKGNLGHHSNLNQHARAVYNVCTPAEVNNFEPPQDMIIQTLEPRVQRLNLGRNGVTDVETGLSVSDEPEGWSLVEYTDTDTVGEAHMDLDNG